MKFQSSINPILRKILVLLVTFIFTTIQGYSQVNLLSNARGYYPRVIRLNHNGLANGKIIVSFDNGNTGTFYESSNNGSTWTAEPIGTITDNTPPRNCCSGFWEVPQQLGNTAAGTLFWATSVGTDQTPRTACSIRLYKSTDIGRTWSFLSTIVKGDRGLWEPEFSVDNQGNLLCFFSSEEYKPEENQIIAHRISTDGGLTWGADVKDVVDGSNRPGMSVVRKLPNGNYVMTYEICGSNCDVYIKTSSNGSNWGTGLGNRIESTTGNHFAHAPTISWANDGTANGKLIAIGQILVTNSNNTLANGNGGVFMTNSNNGVGLWTEVTAPISIPNNGDEPCQNYTTQLLPSMDGKNVLQVALKLVNGVCKVHYSTGSLNSPPPQPSTLPEAGKIYELEPKNALGKRLNQAGIVPNANANIFERNNSKAQQWKLIDNGGGYYSLEPQSDLGKRLDVNGGGSANETNVLVWNDLNNDAQKWKLIDVGEGYYELEPKCAIGKRMDVARGQSANNTNVQIYQTNDLDPQKWKFMLKSDALILGSNDSAISNENEEQTLTVYPNPNDQELKIQFKAKHNEQINIQIFDVQGKVVEKVYEGTTQTGQTKNFTVNASKIQQGTYLIEVDKNSGKIATKIIIVH